MRRAGAAVAALGAIAALPSVGNGFVYDDVPILLENPLVHALGRSPELWHASYWPVGLLYRPLTLQLFALEWRLGGGRPVLFHLVSVVLAALTAWLVYRLARALLPAVPALLAGAVFAVHPVHVEATANVVGQSELLAALFALLAVERYLAWRSSEGLTPARRLLLAGLTLLGIFAKETGYAIPLLLVAAEAFAAGEHPRDRRVRSTLILQGFALAAGLLLRVVVLGRLQGENPAAALRGLSLPERVVAMLPVIPEWLRLLVWPVHLQAEYGPPGLPVGVHFGAAHLAGLLLLVAGAGCLLVAWRRRSLAGFALLWIAIALLPVSNVAIPSGVVLAERNLFLPSVGLALLAGVGLARIAPSLEAAARWRRLAFFVAMGAAFALCLARSQIRAVTWRSQDEFFRQMGQDAPDVYRAHLVRSRYQYGVRRFAEAEASARRALELYPADPQIHEQLGQVLRSEGRCAEAVPVLAQGLLLDPEGTTLRSRLIECALASGDTTRARAAAADAVARGQEEFRSTLTRLRPAGSAGPAATR